MITQYKFNDLPDCYFGDTYDGFCFEVYMGNPKVLYLHSLRGDYITITDLETIRTCSPRSDEFYVLRNAEKSPGRNLTKSERKRLEELRQENNVNDLRYELVYQRFLRFLSSIKLVDGPWPFAEDVKYVRDRYGITMNVLNSDTKAEDETWALEKGEDR